MIDREAAEHLGSELTDFIRHNGVWISGETLHVLAHALGVLLALSVSRGQS